MIELVILCILIEIKQGCFKSWRKYWSLKVCYFLYIDFANQYRYHTRELILVTSLAEVVDEHLPRIDPF